MEQVNSDTQIKHQIKEKSIRHIETRNRTYIRPSPFLNSSEEINGMTRKESPTRKLPKKIELRRPFLINYIGRIKEKVKRLRQRLGFGRLENLSSRQLTIINDLCYIPSYQEENSPRINEETAQKFLSKVKI